LLQFPAVSGCWGWFYRNNRPSVALQTVRSLAQSRYGRQVMQDRSVRSARLVCNAAVIRIDIYYSVMHYMMLGVAIWSEIRTAFGPSTTLEPAPKNTSLGHSPQDLFHHAYLGNQFLHLRKRLFDIGHHCRVVFHRNVNQSAVVALRRHEWMRVSQS